jgi:hypothetical protein
MARPIRIGPALLLAAVLLAGCAGPGIAPPPRHLVSCQELSPAKQYAGQVLAYLMHVVLGRAGHPELKEEWGRRGIDFPLDFERISRVMLEPDQNRSKLVVFDTRILGISEVLYHYDPGLNLFKGQNGRQSLFPSVELIALRLLLLQKMNRGEKIRLQGLLDCRKVILDSSLPVTAKDLSETGLSGEEMHLVQDAFRSDPHLFSYLFCPAMVKGLYEIGAVAFDPVVAAVLRAKSPVDSVCRFPRRTGTAPAVRISVLPSMMPQFCPERSGAAPAAPAFRPDDAYLRLSRRLEEQILASAGERVGLGRLPQSAVLFSEPQQRPLAVYPENADVVLSRLCPEADFTIILLGKDVIRSFDIVPHTGPPLPGNRLYIDIKDVERSWIAAEVEIVAQFIAERLGAVGGG